jgi:hypothetical protein
MEIDRINDTFVLTLNNPENGKAWVAILTGKDDKYIFKREFVRKRSSASKITSCYYVPNGCVIEVNDAQGRRYYEVLNGLSKISREKAIELVG